MSKKPLIKLFFLYICIHLIITIIQTQSTCYYHNSILSNSATTLHSHKLVFVKQYFLLQHLSGTSNFHHKEK